MKKERSSNIELLRIVAMLMIIVYHIWCHTINIQLSTDVNYFVQPLVYKRLFIFSIISPFGQIANALFILISGYFLCERKSIDVAKIAKKLLSQNIFVTLNLIIASIFLYKLLPKISITLVTINHFNTESWFIGYYFIIVLAGTLFLNDYFLKIDRKKYVSILIVLFAITQFQWTSVLVDGLSLGLSTFLIGILLYLCGGYLKKYKPFRNIKSIFFVLVIIISFLFAILSDYNAISSNIENYYLKNYSGNFTTTIQGYSNNYLIPVVISLCIFELFNRIKVKNNKTINFIGGSTLMIYIMHDNHLWYSMWNYTNWIKLLSVSISDFFYNYLLWTLGTFYCGIVLYFIYVICIKELKKTLNFFIKK